MYEGAPDHPRKDRFWEIIDRYKVTIFYTSPTAIRAFMAWGIDWVKPHNLGSLRLLVRWANRSTPRHGDGIPKHWQNRCPIVGYVVANGNWRDYDFADSRGNADQAWIRDASAAWKSRQKW